MEEESSGKIQIQIISKKTIKPSSPTPHNKRILKLSLVDQTYSSTYGPFIFFYTKGPTEPKTHFAHLAESLSQSLTHFYPFAGRLNDNVSIECNDGGAHLFEAQANCELSEFLRRPDPRSIKAFLPVPDPNSAALLLVQLTAFPCGGTAVGVSTSHKLADAASIKNLVRDWSSLNSGRSGDRLPPPEFPGASLFPPPDPPIRRALPLPRGRASASRRFVFTASKLAELKARRIRGPSTTVEAVTALLFKAAVAAAGERSGVIRQHVDLRRRMTPPLPENSVGNLIWSFLVFAEVGPETELGEVVAAMRKEMAEFLRSKIQRLGSVVREFVRTEAELDGRGRDMCCFTSLGRLGVYEVDFGEGRPAWVTCPLFNDNMFVLTWTRCGGGIEAWVTLEEQRMAKFEADEELLQFAMVNPSASPYNCRL